MLDTGGYRTTIGDNEIIIQSDVGIQNRHPMIRGGSARCLAAVARPQATIYSRVELGMGGNWRR